MVKHIFREIGRRKVIPVIAPYAIAAWLLMQIATLVVPALALAPWIVPLVVVLLLVGFPVALYVAWFFDFTNDGIKRTPSLGDEIDSSPLTMGYWLGFGAVAIAASGIGYITFNTVLDEREKTGVPILQASLERSIAILPFRDLSPEQDQAYLAVGLAEELTVALGKQEGLMVTALNSALGIQHRGLTPRERADLLGVSTLLDGSVRINGDRLNVTATLVNGENGRTLWTEKFSRSFDDVFAVQEEIARAIIGTLFDRYLDRDDEPITGRATAAEAYVMYLRGRQAFRLRTSESLSLAREYFEQAISSDPEYAPAYVGLADTLQLLTSGENRYGNLAPKIVDTLARQYLAKAFVRDDNLAEAYASLGLLEAAASNFDDALAAYDKALEINPNFANAYLWRYLGLVELSRIEDSFADLLSAFELDPVSRIILRNLSLEYARRGNFPEALEAAATLIEQDRRSPHGYVMLANVAFRSGDIVLSAENWKKAADLSEASAQFRNKIIGLFFALELADPIRAVAGEDFAVNIAIADRDFQTVFSMMDFAVAANPDDPWILFESGLYHFLYGDVSKGGALFQDAMNEMSDADQFSMPFCSPAIELAHALKSPGHVQRSIEIAEKCRALMQSHADQSYVSANLDYLGARIAVLNDDQDEAVRLLQEAFENGWREYWTADDPTFEPLSDRPEYQKFIRELNADLAEQRSRLKSISKDWFKNSEEKSFQTNQ